MAYDTFYELLLTSSKFTYKWISILIQFMEILYKIY